MSLRLPRYILKFDLVNLLDKPGPLFPQVSELRLDGHDLCLHEATVSVLLCQALHHLLPTFLHVLQLLLEVAEVIVQP